VSEVGAGGLGEAYETVVGVEVHVQLRTEAKMFCGCAVEFGAEPNTRVCPVCLGLPGALPVPNQRAVELGVRAALALGCTVRERSTWARKHYFYPDLPKGYQISQHGEPLARDGRVILRREDGTEGRVGVRRLHLEEDAGKSLHDRVPGRTAVDLNRCGVPLAEIVSEPDLRSPGEARRFLVRLKQLLEHYARVSDCNMEEGSLRVDANLSVRPRGSPDLGTRTEVKNLNSFRHVERALAFERDRQIDRLEAGEAVEQETRLWDADRGETRPMRGKEEATDYRYVPDPDLPPLRVPAGRRREQAERLPELPHRLEARLVEEVGLPEGDAAFLAAYPERWRYYRAVLEAAGLESAKTAANFLMGPLAEELNRRGAGSVESDLLPPEALARVVELRREGVLSSTTADRALELILTGQEPPRPDRVVEEHGLAQVRDQDRLSRWVEEAVESNPEEARRYAEGETKLLGFFMGRVMELAGGRADPREARELLRDRLEDPPGE
jgi:aspartyl-tRNA(Asn)/glutamyl-tRNA(Gln) amidotransferase subunit B